jgi:hypothetical protein
MTTDTDAVPSLTEELASMTRMFHAACADLGAINEALGLDPDDGGAEPILDAIAELKTERDKWVDANFSASASSPTPSAQEEAVRVPEGYALVPLKPNDAMQAAGAQAVRIDTTVLNRMWTANRVFQAMVEAAASAGDQEVNDGR